MDIKGFIPNSLLEWEGKIASVIFLPGCNLRCRYCHAAHLVLNPERVESMSREAILGYMREHSDWLDGVVISGGEPTLHGADLVNLIGDVRAIPLQVMLETNGTRPGLLGDLVADGMLDAVAMDLKAPLNGTDYGKVTWSRVDVTSIRRSVALVKGSGLPHELRVTLVPGLVGAEELRQMGPDLEGAQQVALQNFRPEFSLDPGLRGTAPYSEPELQAMCAIVEPLVGRCVVRGRDGAATFTSRSEQSS